MLQHSSASWNSPIRLLQLEPSRENRLLRASGTRVRLHRSDWSTNDNHIRHASAGNADPSTGKLAAVKTRQVRIC